MHEGQAQFKPDRVAERLDGKRWVPLPWQRQGREGRQCASLQEVKTRRWEGTAEAGVPTESQERREAVCR